MVQLNKTFKAYLSEQTNEKHLTSLIDKNVFFVI